MPEILHRIGVNAPITTVRAAVSAVTGISGWWSDDARAVSGNQVDVRFKTPEGDEIGRVILAIAAPANSHIRWRFTAGPEEWLGTEVTFDLTEEDGQVTVLFGHRGWREPVEFMSHCSMKWATFLLSLRRLAETGWGLPSPYDLKIDNWN